MTLNNLKITENKSEYINPVFYAKADLNVLLKYCLDIGASDITIQAGHYVFVERQGALVTIGSRILSVKDVEDIAVCLYGDNVIALVMSGHDIDISYNDCLYSRKVENRFRVNITACHYKKGIHSLQISLRVIPSTPPSLENVGVNIEFYEKFKIQQGVVIVSGATGSGKSSLLAAVINKHLCAAQHGLKILTYESPIEYTYSSQDAQSIISQTEVPRYLPSFCAGVRNALRRKPGLIMVGETRDLETLDAVLEAALTGHPVYTTIHSNSVVDTFKRVFEMFPYEQRGLKMHTFLSSARLLVWQTLVPNLHGGQVAIREHLTLTPKLRAYLLSLSLNKLQQNINDIFATHGVTRQQSAHAAFEQQLISLSTYQKVSTL
ncbi:ATPase, T2SS/T4P/T4SS family [Facilibium subflavum]|uniref:ATPase, T2SS/T4P/T4SS family n=1 Tax=Facilibium subflavum TaxID=2219058 RepID=UPI000E657563|nr:ATPase, T2SS/T4P/T4SS family [Facilibium subflavum]